MLYKVITEALCQYTFTVSATNIRSANKTYLDTFQYKLLIEIVTYPLSRKQGGEGKKSDYVKLS